MNIEQKFDIIREQLKDLIAEETKEIKLWADELLEEYEF
jgi:hypothetical protein